MSDQSHATSLPKAEVFDQQHAGNLPFVLPIAGGVALLISLVWGFFDREQFAFSWLLLFFIPLLFCSPILLAWWDIDPNTNETLLAKQPCLTHGFFYLRLVIY